MRSVDQASPEKQPVAALRPGRGDSIGEVVGAVLLVGACGLVVAARGTPVPPHDDAFITFHYAQNLVEGNGLVFNPGEYVEGITNLLWTLLIAAGMRMGIEAPLAGHILGLASGVAVLVATYAYARTELRGRRAWLAGLAVFAVAASFPFLRWVTLGLETPLFAAATTAGIAAAARGRMGWATGALATATMTRPDGGLFAAAVYTFDLASRWRTGWRCLRPAIAFAAVLVGVTAFRLAYYGSPVPNTFYAKVGGVPVRLGVMYWLSFMREGAGFLLVPAAVGAILCPVFRSGAAAFVVFSIYVVSIGGGAFPGSRLLVPLLPVLAVLAVNGGVAAFGRNRAVGIALLLATPLSISWYAFGSIPMAVALACGLGGLGAWVVTGSPGPRSGAAAAAFAAGASILLLSPVLPRPLRLDPRQNRISQQLTASDRWHRETANEGRRKARILAERGEHDVVVAAVGIGALGYYSRVRIVDLLGLVDETIAHSRADGRKHWILPGHHRSNADYVFSREPDYIVLPGESSLIRAVDDIRRHPDFALYEWDAEMRAFRRTDD